jgi:hypothetical protein
VAEKICWLEQGKEMVSLEYPFIHSFMHACIHSQNEFITNLQSAKCYKGIQEDKDMIFFKERRL